MSYQNFREYIRRMKSNNYHRTAGWVTILFALLTLNAGSVSAYPDSLYSATDQEAICEATGEELISLTSDFFPFSLAERARQSAVGWQGMPPGFLDYWFDNIPLRNPLWGYWDTQLIPLEFSRKRTVQPAQHQYRFHSLRPPFSKKPVTRIAYSQDFGFNMSYFDVDFRVFYKKHSFVRLGGNNYLRKGPYPDYTSTQINTYRGQIHHYFSDQWNLDLWYQQFRHRYDIVPWPYYTTAQKVHRVGQLFWINIHFSPAPAHRFILTPIVQKWYDHYWKGNYSKQFKTSVLTTGLQGQYRGDFGPHRIDLIAQVGQDRILSSLHLREDQRFTARTTFAWQYRAEHWQITGETGAYHFQNVGSAPSLSVQFGVQPYSFLSLSLDAGEKPRSLPLIARFVSTDSIHALSSPLVPRRRTLTARFNLRFGNWFHISFSPFFHQYFNAPLFHPEKQQFYQQDLDNSGLQSKMRLQFTHFSMENRCTYSYRNRFFPTVNNVLLIKIPLQLFHQALKLEGFGIYHFVDGWKPLEYTPLFNQFYPGTRSEEQYHWLDFKLLAHIQSATLFFVWTNTLSEDYAIVDNYWEFYRTFRLGIYWTLFD